LNASNDLHSEQDGNPQTQLAALVKERQKVRSTCAEASFEDTQENAANDQFGQVVSLRLLVLILKV